MKSFQKSAGGRGLLSVFQECVDVSCGQAEAYNRNSLGHEKVYEYETLWRNAKRRPW